MTSAVDLIRGTTPSTRAGAGRAAGWRCPPEGERQRHPEKADGREGHCTWPDHCSRPSQPLAQSLRSASAPEGPERSGGGAERLAAVRIARTTLPGDGLGPARPGPNLPPPRLVDKHLWEVGEAVAPAGSPHRDCATAPRFPRLPQLHFLPNLNPCKKVESPSRTGIRVQGVAPFRGAERRACRSGDRRSKPCGTSGFRAKRPSAARSAAGAGLETGVPGRLAIRNQGFSPSVVVRFSLPASPGAGSHSYSIPRTWRSNQSSSTLTLKSWWRSSRRPCGSRGAM